MTETIKRFRCGTYKNGVKHRYEGPWACCENCATKIALKILTRVPASYDEPADDLHPETEEERHEFYAPECEEKGSSSWCGCFCHFCDSSIRVVTIEPAVA